MPDDLTLEPPLVARARRRLDALGDLAPAYGEAGDAILVKVAGALDALTAEDPDKAARLAGNLVEDLVALGALGDALTEAIACTVEAAAGRTADEVRGSPPLGARVVDALGDYFPGKGRSALEAIALDLVKRGEVLVDGKAITDATSKALGEIVIQGETVVARDP